MISFATNLMPGMYTLMIGIFAFGLEQPRTLAIACGVVVAAYGPLCILLSFAVSMTCVFC